MIWRHFPHASLRDMHDGDTCEVEIDQGFGVRQRVAVRLFGISAPETNGAEKELGFAALRAAREMVSLPEHPFGAPCELWTWKQSFARYVGRVMLLGKVDLARSIIGQGFAHAWDGKTERRHFSSSCYPMRFAVQDEVEAYDRLLELEFRP